MVAPTADAAQCPAPVPGTLTLDTVPWTSVSVDGVRVGTTPLFRAELPLTFIQPDQVFQGNVANLLPTVLSKWHRTPLESAGLVVSHR
jgi:hypothetical protein